jgi:hypothetical protein
VFVWSEQREDIDTFDILRFGGRKRGSAAACYDVIGVSSYATGSAVACAMVTHWVCNFAIGQLFLPATSIFGVSAVYLGFAGVCILAALFVQTSVLETKVSVATVAAICLLSSKLVKSIKTSSLIAKSISNDGVRIL